jgi:hypothetical protein
VELKFWICYTITVIQLSNYYADADNGFGNPAISIQSCVDVAGYVINNTDCNDAAPTVYPGQTGNLL